MSRVMLDWIAQSGQQSNLVDWIVIDNSYSKLDFGFGFSITTSSWIWNGWTIGKKWIELMSFVLT